MRDGDANKRDFRTGKEPGRGAAVCPASTVVAALRAQGLAQKRGRGRGDSLIALGPESFLVEFSITRECSVRQTVAREISLNFALLITYALSFNRSCVRLLEAPRIDLKM